MRKRNRDRIIRKRIKIILEEKSKISQLVPIPIVYDRSREIVRR